MPSRPLRVEESQQVLLAGLAALPTSTDPAEATARGLAHEAALALGEVTGVGRGPASDAARPLLSLTHEIEEGRVAASPGLRLALEQAMAALDPPGPSMVPPLIQEYRWGADGAYVRTHLMGDWDSYREARVKLLDSSGLRLSNRDPMAEFSEALVRVLYKGSVARSRMQRSWDVLSALNRRIHVEYLANPVGSWVNNHLVLPSSEVDDCALVIFIDLMPESVLVFPAAGLGPIGALLETRRPQQEMSLELTQRNYSLIRSDPGRFALLGVDVWLRIATGEWSLARSDGALAPWPRVGIGPPPTERD